MLFFLFLFLFYYDSIADTFELFEARCREYHQIHTMIVGETFCIYVYTLATQK